jgi:hypothetical protein
VGMSRNNLFAALSGLGVNRSERKIPMTELVPCILGVTIGSVGRGDCCSM